MAVLKARPAGYKASTSFCLLTFRKFSPGLQKAWNGLHSALAYRSNLLWSGFYLNNWGRRWTLSVISRSIPYHSPSPCGSRWNWCAAPDSFESKNPSLLHFWEFDFFSFNIILSLYSSINPTLLLHNYPKFKSNSKFSPREKATHSQKRVPILQNFFHLYFKLGY